MKTIVFQNRLCVWRTWSASLLTLFCIGVSSAATAHGDHDAPAAPAGTAAPRFVAVSDLFEVVGIKSDKDIRIFIDRFATNVPVLNAKLNVEVGGTSIAATFQADDGTYLLPKDPFTKPGSYALVVNVEAGDEIDILAANLVVPDAAAEEPHSHSKDWIALIAAGLGALVAVWLLVRFVRGRGANKSWGARHAQ